MDTQTPGFQTDREMLWKVVEILGCGGSGNTRFVTANDPLQDNDNAVLSLLKSYLVGDEPE